MGFRGIARNIIFAYFGLSLTMMSLSNTLDRTTIMLYGIVIAAWSLWWLVEMLFEVK